jgi:hypothetical protein
MAERRGQSRSVDGQRRSQSGLEYSTVTIIYQSNESAKAALAALALCAWQRDFARFSNVAAFAVCYDVCIMNRFHRHQV